MPPRLLARYVEKPRPCSYLAAETASLETRFLVDVEPAELEAMLERGWRRFGPAYFRPVCSPCGECVSLRLPVARFEPSRSQRRAAKSSASLRRVVGPVRADAERLALYAAWHAGREHDRGWDAMPLDRKGYERDFGFPHPSAHEIAYYDDDAPGANGPRLVGLGLCDETPRAWSAAYFFYDPTYAHRSPGTFHVLTLVDLARAQGKAYVYLGYRIEGCASMRYKAGFRPHELLQGRPAAEEAPGWAAPDL